MARGGVYDRALMPQEMRTLVEALDHLLIGAPTLEAGVAWLEGRTGVRAAPGGSHPGLGTWNALASLGPAQYIEIIAPDPNQPGIETVYVPGLRDFPEPRIATWAARGVGLTSGFVASLSRDLSCEPVRRGTRVRTDGERLNWTLAFPRHRQQGTFAGALPFLIEWDSLETHPGRSTPAGLTLRGMSIRHPQNEGLRGALASLGIAGAVEVAASPSIQVELDTPRGVVVVG